MARSYMESKIMDIIKRRHLGIPDQCILEMTQEIIELIKQERDVICSCYYKAETKCYAKKEKK